MLKLAKLFAVVMVALTALAMSPAQALQQSDVPTKFAIPWANSATALPYYRPIPQASQIGLQNCAASLTDGFPPLTFVPASAGGCPPFGADFNGIFKQITQWSRWYSAGGGLFWDSSFSTSVTGYPKGAVLANLTVTGCFWTSTADNNTTNPDSGGANWSSSCPGPNGAVGGTSGGSANSQTVTTTPFIISTGVTVTFKAGFTNSSSTLLNVNSAGAAAVVKRSLTGATTSLIGGEITSGTVIQVAWNGTQWELISTGGMVPSGTTGYALIGTGAAAQPTFQGFVQTGTGAATRTWNSKAADWINSKDFGAVCDGVANDTTALNNAIAATPEGGTLILQPGTCLISASLNVTRPITIIGAGMSTNAANTPPYGGTVIATTGMSSLLDAILVKPTLGSTTRGYYFSDFTVGYGGGGGYPLQFDTTGTGGTDIAEVFIQRVQFLSGSQNYSISLNNGNGNNNGAGGGGRSGSSNGGVFNFTLQNSVLSRGLLCTYCGDSIRILNNIITSSVADGISLNQVAGAGAAWIAGNNVTAKGAAVSMSQGIGLVIGPANEFEQITPNNNGDNTIIDLNGGIAELSNPKIIGNQMQDVAATGNPSGLFIGRARGTMTDNNRFGPSTARNSVIISVNSTGAIMGPLNFFTAAGAGTLPGVTNSGASSRYMPTTALP